MSKPKSNTPRRGAVAFAAIDPYLEQYVVLPTEKELPGQDRVQWGTGNRYPDYINELYETVPTLQTIINGSVDFVAGDEVTMTVNKQLRDRVNHSGETPRIVVREMALDVFKLGGFALQVIRGMDGSVVEVYYIDLRFLRLNKEGDVFYYSEKWGERGRRDAVVYPAFRPDIAEKWAGMDEDERNRNASSILYVKATHSQVYPLPVYAASVKACEIERLVDDYHLNSICNGFASSLIVNFNNGQPTDEMKEEIERDFDEKFTGSGNAGRVMFSWNKSKENATTFEVPPVTDFGEKYKALAENSREKIFTAFRAYPNLFGLSTATGFSIEEFDQAFKLYNRTAVRPVQRMIADAYDRIYGQRGVLNIVPFSLDGQNEQIVN
jgi:hypothetical protein